MKTEKPFPNEAALCAAFIESVDDHKWTAYAETAGWDILMVRKADGFQIGIQAKQKMNAEVITQALEEYGHWSVRKPGPDCRAVLVPTSAGFGRICSYLGLVVIQAVLSFTYLNGNKWRFDPSLPSAPPASDHGQWPEWAPLKRHKLPEYVPDVVAGASGPTQLTDWKIAAIKMAVLLEHTGFVTRDDFHHLQIDHRRWVEGGWLTRGPTGMTAGPNWPGFKKQHPKVYIQIEADFEKWKPKVPLLKPVE